MLELEPAAVGRIRVRNRTLEIGAAVADVGEHAVQNDLHAALVRLVAEVPEIVLCAEHRVDAGIVIRVVPVRRPGHEDRVEVERLDAEIMQIIQLFAHAGEIAAEKVVICDLTAFVRLPDGDVVRVAVNPVGLELVVQVGLTGFCKAVGEDLVHDRALERGRHGKFLRDDADLPPVAVLHICVVALLEQAERFVLRGDLEEIEIEVGVVQREGCRPRLIQLRCGGLGHGNVQIRLAVFTQ